MLYMCVYIYIYIMHTYTHLIGYFMFSLCLSARRGGTSAQARAGETLLTISSWLSLLLLSSLCLLLYQLPLLLRVHMIMIINNICDITLQSKGGGEGAGARGGKSSDRRAPSGEPSAETAFQPLIWHTESLSSHASVSPEDVFVHRHR